MDNTHSITNTSHLGEKQQLHPTERRRNPGPIRTVHRLTRFGDSAASVEAVSDPSNAVIWRILNKRLRCLVQEIWTRLPRTDQIEILRVPTLIVDWNDTVASQPASGREQQAAPSPCAATRAIRLKDHPCTIVVLRRDVYLPNPVQCYVIAHQLAHARLQHPQVLNRLHGLSKPEATTEIEVMDEIADCQVLQWGFEQELVAAIRWSDTAKGIEASNSRRPQSPKRICRDRHALAARQSSLMRNLRAPCVAETQDAGALATLCNGEQLDG